MGVLPSYREPVSNTCDTLDKIITTLEDVCDSFNAIKEEIKSSKINMDDKLEIMESLLVCKVTLENLSNGDLSPLETIRSANEKLRDWGNELVESHKEILSKKKKKGNKGFDY